VLAADGPLPPRRLAALVRDLARALAVAHARGILHRDLKPANVMLSERGQPVVVDFGLARLPNAGGLTREGQLLGTPAYMAPEQIVGDLQRLGPATDVYGLGALLYEGLTGRPPYTGPISEVMRQALTQSPAPPSTVRPGLDPNLEAICLKA